ncbi:hypothetical protein [Blastopirellula retiformator]|uniref:ERCC4 domain-containing protein n=1 Tax=Blastopirellula retiformator TaxID=2527970 RepID=A0A5C5UYX9_9BACT|nr:hypothetical protein [Blastopirellula retiformator]TWT30687.1 hypothetical protein Enr8_42100 [Blastopirellula retiformator]
MTMKPLINPYTILIDSAEQAPFSFQGMTADSNRGYRPIVINWGQNLRRECLGRYPDSRGDYSVEGLEQLVGVERKSMEDIQGTILGFEKTDRGVVVDTGRRERFEQELSNLAALPFACVIVEANLDAVVTNVPEWGSKPPEVNGKILFRSILSFQNTYRVPWFFCGCRRLAEITAFRFLDRAVRKIKEQQARERKAARMARNVSAGIQSAIEIQEEIPFYHTPPARKPA